MRRSTYIKLTQEEKSMMTKRRGRRIVKFWFGFIFRGITYFLIFGRHRDENGKTVGGRWYPTDKELELKAKIKEAKKEAKLKNKDAKAKVKAPAKAAKAEVKAKKVEAKRLRKAVNPSNTETIAIAE